MISVTPFAIFVLLVLFNPVAFAEDSSPEPAKPTLIVSLQRQSIRESDSIPAEVILVTADGSPLQNVMLHISSPESFSWYEIAKKEKVLLRGNDLRFGDVPANTVIKKKLYVTTPPNITVGSYNLLFTAHYRTGDKTGVSVVEKGITTNLFGSDTIAGVPLSLAGYVVPGLFFWIVTSCFSVPWSVGLALGEKMVYSVMVSVALIFVGATIHWERFLKGWEGIDVTKGVSSEKLIWLAANGAAAGGIAVALTKAVQSYMKRRTARQEISLNEAPESIFRKLLSTNPDAGKIMYKFVVENGEVYFCSLFEQTGNTPTLSGFLSAAGWCVITREIVPDGKRTGILSRLLRSVVEKPEEQMWQQMERLFKENRLLELYDQARRWGYKIQLKGLATQTIDPKTKIAAFDYESGPIAKQWSNSAVKSWPERLDHSHKPVHLVGR